MKIEIAFVGHSKQLLEEFEVPVGTTIAGALALTNFADKIKPTMTSDNNLGIFGKLKSPNTILCNGDRIEIYRNLIADPKDQRREKVEQVRKHKPKHTYRT